MPKLAPIIAAALALAVQTAPCRAAEPAKRPNVLFIAVDDLNDWLGCLGGHKLVKTPNLDRLAARGTLFTNAHCQAPLCNPSRTSLLFGLRPTTTGVYGLSPSLRAVPGFEDRTSLPQYFHKHGYQTLAGGKIFHGRPAKAAAKSPVKSSPAKSDAEMDVWGPNTGVGARPSQKLIGPTPMGDNPLMDWGAFPHADSDKGDYQLASWAIEQLETLPQDKPFFLAAGFFLPHVPCYVTPAGLAEVPDDDTVLPAVRDDDRSDTPRFSWYLHWNLPEPRLKWVREAGQWRNLCRSYLASIQFVDAQIGRILTALEKTGHTDDTIVVVWGDHGWHLGEKGITGKNTLWERSTKVPLIFAGPGVSAAIQKDGAQCSRPAELMDMYPTLAELCGLPEPPGMEGISLVPQLKDAAAPRERPAITSHNQGNHAVRSDHHRYIRYADGSEELYDHRTDPNEWTNLVADAAGKSQHAATVAEHARWLPKVDVPPAPKSASRILTYDPKTDEAVWEGKTVVKRTDPIPE
jgi:arylsulfatase A-like enzyme